MSKTIKITEDISSNSAMQIEMWPIDRPIPYARNARKLSAQAVDKVAASLKEFGWQQPIVVDAQRVIIVGHTRLMAAKKLGMIEVPVLIASHLTPAQVKAYRLMDNRSHQEASWDFELLGPDLLDLKALDLDLKLTGFNSDELAAMFSADGWEPDENLAKRGGHMDGLEYRVVVDCQDEMQQTELLDRFQQEGLKCRALIS
jgi:hypothetical protein